LNAPVGLDEVTDRCDRYRDGVGGQPRILDSMVSLGRSLPIVVSAIGLAMLMTFLSERTSQPEPAVGPTSTVTDGALTRASADVDGGTAEGSDRSPSLRIRVQMPVDLRAGGARQFRISVHEASRRAWDDRRDPLLLLELRLEHPDAYVGTAIVTPDALVLRRSDLHRTPLKVHVFAHVGCDTRLGDLHVRVREISASEATGERTIELPPVDCRTPPPAPESVHDTEPTCLDDELELQTWVLTTDDPPEGELCRDPGLSAPPRTNAAEPDPPAEEADPDDAADPNEPPEGDEASDDDPSGDDQAGDDQAGDEDEPSSNDAEPDEAEPDEAEGDEAEGDVPSADGSDGSGGSEASDGTESSNGATDGENDDQDEPGGDPAGNANGANADGAADVAERRAGGQ
jgi:hypothetical protein